MPLPFATIAFDLDGTLVDSNPDLAAAINHALVQHGRAPIAADATRALIGGGARQMIARALALTGGCGGEDEVDRHYAAFLPYYTDHIADLTRPYPGCIAALDALAAAGCQLAVVTNKLEAMALALLDALNLADRFAVILGRDTLGPGRAKPAPDMLLAAQVRCGGGAMAMVGDSTFDIRAARAAGMPAVAVSFGYNDLPAAELGADTVIDDYAALLPALSRLGALTS